MKPALFCSLLLVVLTACHTSNKTVLPLVYSFELNDEQVADDKNKSLLGDRDAAFKLYEFYEYVKLDRNEVLRWLTKAAENGHVAAQYTMGMSYNGEIYPDLKDLAKARYWFQRAADNGCAEARQRLNELPVK